jgi:hypothetical protein
LGPVELGNRQAREGAIVTGIMKNLGSVSKRVASVGRKDKKTAAIPVEGSEKKKIVHSRNCTLLTDTSDIEN